MKQGNHNLLLQNDIRDYHIFFIAGLPKSGTTWMMNMLNSFENICCLGEGKFFSSVLKDIPCLYEAIKNGIYTWHNFIAHRKNNWLALDKYITTINKTNHIPIKILNKSLISETDLITRNYILYLFNRLRQPCTQLIGDKSPLLYINEFKRILRVFPEAKIIFLVRRLEDFIVSLLFHFWRSNKNNRSDKYIRLLEVEDFIFINNFITKKQNSKRIARSTTIKRLAKIWKNINSSVYTLSNFNKQILIIKYDDLKLDTYKHLKNILNFLNLDISDAEINNVINKNSIDSIKKSNNTVLKEHINSHRIELSRYINSDLNRLLDSYQNYIDNLEVDKK